MAYKKVGGKNKPKDAASKKETDKKSDSGGVGRRLRTRTATKEGENIHEKAKSKKPMAEEGNLRIDSAVQKGKHTPAKRIRNADKNEKEKSNLDGTERVLRSRNVRKGNEIGDGTAKGKKFEVEESPPTNVEVGRNESAVKRKFVAEEENAGKIRAPAKRRNAGQEIAEANVSTGEGSYNLRAKRGVPSFRKVDLNESGLVQVVGKRVKVRESSSRKWITGKIESYDRKHKLHKVLCDDGDWKELELKTQSFLLEVMPGEIFTLSFKHKLNTKKKQTDSYGCSVDAESMMGHNGPVEKHSKSTRKVSTRAAKRGHSKLQQKENAVVEKAKCQKGKKIISNGGSDDQSLDMEEIDEEMDSDGDLVIADIVKNHLQKVANAGPEKKLPKQKEKMLVSDVKNRVYRMQKREDCRNEVKDVRESSLKIGDAKPMVRNPKLGRIKENKVEKSSSDLSQKRQNTEKKPEDAASKKTVSKRLSAAQTRALQRTKKDGRQLNVERRKNPARKRANTKTK